MPLKSDVLVHEIMLPLLRSEQGSAAVIKSNLDPSPDRFDPKVNGRSIQAAALGYCSNLSRITYLLSKRNLEIFDRFVNQSHFRANDAHPEGLRRGRSKYGVFWVRTRFISVASSVNFAGSCSREVKVANSFHRSKFFDT
jgi:hypothetical protein